MPSTRRGAVLADALLKHRQYPSSAIYDETLDVVVERVAEAGCLTKADIGSLVLWKRISAQTTWAGTLGATPDSEVRAVTARAYALANASNLSIPEAGQQARWVLNDLPGMKPTSEGALASAVLVACAPKRMAVWDRRVKVTLASPVIDLPVSAGQRYYGRYLQAAVELASEMEARLGSPVAPRDVDLALWVLGG